MIGSSMKILIEIGKKRGFVTTEDVNSIYPAPRRRHEHSLAKSRMNKLVVFGYFKKPTNYGIGLKWEYTGKETKIIPHKIGVCNYCEKGIWKRSEEDPYEIVDGRLYHKECYEKIKEKRLID